MKKMILLFCALMVVFTPLTVTARERATDCCGTDAVCDGARGAMVLSMMGWGVGLAVGIALLTGLLDQNTSSHAH